MKDDNDLRSVRESAVQALGDIGAAARPMLVEVLKDKDPWIRGKAVCVLVASMGEAAIPLVLEMLKDKEAHVRQSALRALDDMRPVARNVIPVLIEMFKDDDVIVRDYTEQVLRTFGELGVPLLTAALKNSNPYIRTHAGCCLLQMNPARSEVVKLMIVNLKHPVAPVRERAAVALAYAGRHAAPGLEAIVEAINAKENRETGIRTHLLEVLEKLGPGAKKAALPGIIQTIKDGDEAERDSAIDALRGLGKEARQAIPTLIEALEDELPTVRFSAAFALGKMGKYAHEAVPALQKALKDSDRDVRNGAVYALKKIEGQSRK